MQIEPEHQDQKPNSKRVGLRDYVIPKLYRSITEVSTITGVEHYVLRFWETEFEELSPFKNRAGNRVYSDKDVNLISRIKKLIRDEHHTVDSAKKIIKEDIEAERIKKLEEAVAKPIKDEAQIPMITPPPSKQVWVDVKKIEELKGRLKALRGRLSE